MSIHDRTTEELREALRDETAYWAGREVGTMRPCWHCSKRGAATGDYCGVCMREELEGREGKA